MSDRFEDPSVDGEVLSLERYAVILAYLRHYEKRSRGDVLRALREDAERFDRSADLWGPRIAAAAEESEAAETVLRFGAAYGECVRRLRRERPVLCMPEQDASRVDETTDHAKTTASSAATGLAPAEMSLAQVSAFAAREARGAARADASAPMFDLDVTREAVAGDVKPALPFGRERSPEFLAEWVRERAVGARPDSVGGLPGVLSTEELDIGKLRAHVLPFGAGGRRVGAVPGAPAGATSDSERAAGVPPMPLERYAEFRARLSLVGETDADTWKAFGITSAAAKAALEVAFAERFRSEPAAQQRFVALVRQAVEAQRRGP